jgi:hypothetical protein
MCLYVKAIEKGMRALGKHRRTLSLQMRGTLAVFPARFLLLPEVHRKPLLDRVNHDKQDHVNLTT